MDTKLKSVSSHPGQKSNEKDKRDQFRKIIERRIREHISLRRPMYVNLGLDLGTSFTKVVWRFGETARPICFGESPISIADYLVPSVVYFDGKIFRTGLDFLNTTVPEQKYKIQNFKMCVACESTPSSTCRVSRCALSSWNTKLFPNEVQGQETFLTASLFLGKILSAAKRNVETQLFEHMGYAQESIFWSANLAVPEKLMEQSPILSAFEGVFKTAFLMSYVFDRYPNLRATNDIVDCYRIATEIAADQPMDCFVYPEVGAQVASVTMSRTTPDGLFAFVDVGAGTVDASVFRLNSDLNERRLETYAADVLRAGAAHCERSASRRLARESLDWFRNAKEGGDNFAELGVVTVQEVLGSFLEETYAIIKSPVENGLCQLFRAAFNKEPFLDRWSNLQLIKGGGGSSLPVYQNAARGAFTLKGKPRKTPKDIDLPLPHDFNFSGLPAAEFHRFAVAYGLSYNYMDLPKISLADEVEPMRILYKKREVADYYAK